MMRFGDIRIKLVSFQNDRTTRMKSSHSLSTTADGEPHAQTPKEPEYRPREPVPERKLFQFSHHYQCKSMSEPHLNISHNGPRLVVQKLDANLCNSTSRTSAAHHSLHSCKLGTARIFILQIWFFRGEFSHTSYQT